MLAIRTLALTLLLALLPSLALAASEADRHAARAFVEAKQKELTQAVKAKKTSQVESIFDGMFDYRQLAQDSLRDHWQSLTPAQRDEFTDLLKTLVRRAYRKNIDRTLDYVVTIDGTVDAESGVLVKTRAKNTKDEREEPLAIDYVVAKAGAAQKIRDVVTEGASLVDNYRKNFNRVIKNDGGIEGLLVKMRERVKKPE
jgi:phospholipid transport system substrate-binding protein